MTSALAAPPDLQGEQQPRISLVPKYASTSGDEAIELAAMAGLYLDPWQQLVLRHSLGERADGKWAATGVGLVVGRQNGKNAVLEARELAELYLIAPALGPRLVIHSAHQFKTALEHFRRMKARILATPELLARVKHRGSKPIGIRDSHGEESIELVDGSRLLFAARTASGGQGAGFTSDLLVWDEAWNLPDAMLGAVVPTMAARTLGTPGVQTWYTSQAVNQETMPYGVALARIREQGIKGESPRLFYAEWSVDEDEFRLNPDMAEDPTVWAKANPGMGRRIAVDHIAWERDGGLPWAEFLAHRLGVGDWPDTSPESGRVISREAWAACSEHDPSNRVTGVPAFAVDGNMDGTWASIGVAGVREDKLSQVAVVRHDRGTDWVVDACVALRTEHRRAQVVVDKRGPVAHLIPALKLAGVRVLEASTEDYAASCADFVAAVNETAVRYPFPQPELDEALANARKAPLGDRWKWSRKDSAGADISPLVAVTLALWGSKNGKPRGRFINLSNLDVSTEEE